MLGREIYFLAITTTAFALGVYLFKKKRKETIPNNWKEVGTIKNLNIYPLKSGRRIELQSAECTIVGLKETKGKSILQLRDRSLVVFKETNRELRTARNYPNLLLITISAYDENHLILEAPTKNDLYLEIPQPTEDNKISISLHDGEIAYTTDCGNEAAKWISKYLLENESGLRLGYHNGSFKRDITEMIKEDVITYPHLSNSAVGLYSDLASILLVNQKSVDDLNAKLETPCVTSNNFRPNIVVDGLRLEPYIEDKWNWIKIGEVLFRNVRECTRCVMTTINPETAIRASDMEPLKTLKAYRKSKGPEKQPIMGIYLEVKKCGTISVGDEVLIS